MVHLLIIQHGAVLSIALMDLMAILQVEFARQSVIVPILEMLVLIFVFQLV